MAILTTIFSIGIYLGGLDFLDLVEMKSYDLRFHTRGAKAPDNRIVIAAIDQESIDMLGRWPWPRSIQARLLDTLSQAGVRVIGYDVNFPIPDENSELMRVREFLNDYAALGLDRNGGQDARAFYDKMLAIEKGADNDKSLEQAIRRAGNIVLGLFFFLSKDEAGSQDPEMLARDKSIISPYKFPVVQYIGIAPDYITVTKAFGVEPNLERFTKAGKASGFFNMNSDPDGVIRWDTMMIYFDGDYYPSLDLQVARIHLGFQPTDMIVQMSRFGVEGVFLGERAIPADERGRMLINYLGPEKTYPYYPAVRIMDGTIPPETFRDKVVLIGVTAIGIYDMRFTPFGVTAGIEVHAQTIDNILNNDFMVRPDWLAIFDICIIIILGIILGLLLPRMRPFLTALLYILFAGIYAAFNMYIFTVYGMWLNLIYPLMHITLVFGSVTIYRYATEEREKKKIKQSFSRYLSPALVNELSKNPALLRLGGEKKDLTCLFSDIRGFTTISEALDPEKLVELLQEYMTAMTNIVLRYNGLLDKYIGDAIMAVFCTPIEEPDHAARACFTALEMCGTLKTLQGDWQARGFPKVGIGVGINTGEMVVGNMGSTQRFDYTVIGDNVNLASRLEGTNKQYGTQIIISQYTYERVKDQVLARELDAVRVKGKKKPVFIYELLGKAGEDATPAETGAVMAHGFEQDWIKRLITLFNEGLSLYKMRDWKGAEAAFRRVLDFTPDDGPSKVYIERCQQLVISPPSPDWDGVFTMTKK